MLVDKNFKYTIPTELYPHHTDYNGKFGVIISEPAFDIQTHNWYMLVRFDGVKTLQNVDARFIEILT